VIHIVKRDNLWIAAITVSIKWHSLFVHSETNRLTRLFRINLQLLFIFCRRQGQMINNQYGAGTGQIWLDDMACVGSELSIANCVHSPWGTNNCGHNEDVSISCAAPTTTTTTTTTTTAASSKSINQSRRLFNRFLRRMLIWLVRFCTF